MRLPRVTTSVGDLTIVAVHIVSRLTMWWIYAALPYSWKGLAWGDVSLYQRWAAEISRTTAVPVDVSWMYPPGAGAVIVGIEPLAGPYLTSFIVTLVVVDTAMLLLLLGSGAHRSGAWAWAVLPPALGPLSWARLDLLAVAAAAAAIVWAQTRPRLAGALAAVGTAIKAWPVLLGVLFWHRRSWVGAAVATGVGITAISLAFEGSWDFVSRLAGRGIQIESVLATFWLIRQAMGDSVAGDFANGSYELFESGAGSLARASSVLVVVAVAAAWWVSRRRDPAVRWLAMVMALLSTSPLLSTQFILWLIAAAAVAARVGGPDGALARRTLPAVAAITVLSHAGFPIQWGELTGDGDLAAATVATRNLLLVATTAWLLVALGRSVPAGVNPAADQTTPQPSRPTTTVVPPTPDPLLLGPRPESANPPAR